MAVPEARQDGGPVQDGGRSRWRSGSEPSRRTVPIAFPVQDGGRSRWRPITRSIGSRNIPKYIMWVLYELVMRRGIS